MNALLKLRKQMEVDFLKTKTYEEINDMFNQLNDKLKLAKKDIKKLRLGAVSGSFLSDLNFIIDNMAYDLVKDKVCKEAQTEYLKRLKMMRDELRQNSL